MADDRSAEFNETPSDDETRPTSDEGEGSTAGASNPDLHGEAREVAEKSTGEDGPPITPAG